MLAEPSIEELTQLQWQIGRKRITWATKQFTRFQEMSVWKSMEDNPISGEFRNDAGANLFVFFVSKGLKNAASSSTAALSLMLSQHDAIPTEILLRSTLIGAAKALYLLAPDDIEQREKRCERIYNSDRNAQDYARSKEAKLLGLPVPESKTRQGIRESEIIRDAFDHFVEEGNCQCGRPECPDDDRAAIRYRLLRNWWEYSSVAHGNLWHIEQSLAVYPDTDLFTTGNLGQALADVGWVYASAVFKLFLLYDHFDHVEYLNINHHEMLTDLRNSTKPTDQENI